MAKTDQPKIKKVVSSVGGRRKKGVTNYMVFCATVGRPQLKLEDPDMAFGDVNKTLGQMWKALSDEEKAKY